MMARLSGVRFIALAGLCLLLSGCLFESSNRTAQVQPPQPAGDVSGGGDAGDADFALNRAQFNGRRIDETHSLQLSLNADELRARHQRDLAKCVELGCSVIAANVQVAPDGAGVSSASLQSRISPDKLNAYLAFLMDGPGRLDSHQIAADDRTLEYIDTSAQLANLEALRTRLRTLLDTAASSVEDILKIEKELARVQQEIDSVSARKRHLETVTETAAVNVAYIVPFGAGGIDYSALGTSFSAAWASFIENLAMAIQAVGAVIPWIVFALLAAWIATRLYRLGFRRRAAQQA
jgi:hypothetical protein